MSHAQEIVTAAAGAFDQEFDLIDEETMRLQKSLLSLALSLAALSPLATQAQGVDIRTDWPGAGELFVGTNYQPYDRTREQIERDIARRKCAGMKVVRGCHLTDW